MGPVQILVRCDAKFLIGVKESELEEEYRVFWDHCKSILAKNEIFSGREIFHGMTGRFECFLIVWSGRENQFFGLGHVSCHVHGFCCKGMRCWICFHVCPGGFFRRSVSEGSRGHLWKIWSVSPCPSDHRESSLTSIFR